MTKKLLVTASTWGHIRSFHLPYLLEFQRLGWEVHVGCAGIPADSPHVDKAIELPFEKKMQSPANLRALGLLRKSVREERYDRIVTHTSLAAFFTRFAVKGMVDRPKVINVVHGYLFDDETPAAKRRLLLTAERLCAAETDLLLTMDQWDRETAGRYRLGKRIESIPGMGVDFARLDRATEEDGRGLRERLGLPADAFVLLYPAEFSERKSQQVLIRAMARLPERVVLALPGSGALQGDCRALADSLGLQGRILFPGQIEDMGPWYRMADAAVASSRSEGLPFNVMEALHAELPVIASRVKGHVDLITDGENGLLYPYGDASSCASCVERLLSDAALRERLENRAATSVERYRLERVLPEVMEAYLSQL